MIIKCLENEKEKMINKGYKLIGKENNYFIFKKITKLKGGEEDEK